MRQSYSRFCISVFKRCFEECQLTQLPPLLLDLANIRLIESASKLRSLELLSRYFEIKYSQPIYRTIPKLTSWKADIEQRAYNVARHLFKEQFYYVLFDVTTLYFESFKPDELKKRRKVVKMTDFFRISRHLPFELFEFSEHLKLLVFLRF